MLIIEFANNIKKKIKNRCKYKNLPDAELSDDVDLPLMLLSKLRNSLESHSSPLDFLKYN